MPSFKYKDENGIWQRVPNLKYKDQDGVWHDTNNLKYKDENGVWQKVYITKPYHFDPVFENNTWEEIILACHVRQVPDTWLVGDQKTMTINGTDYNIDIIGKNHDDYADGSGKAPLTFQLHECYADLATGMNNSATNVGGWGSSLMRTTHLPSIKALMPVEVQSGLRLVNKQTSEGNSSSEIVTTADDLFLLSELEVFPTKLYACSGEGTQYAYYAEGNSKVKTRNSTNVIWWMRSPYHSDNTYFCCINQSAYSMANTALTGYCISFAFCF